MVLCRFDEVQLQETVKNVNADREKLGLGVRETENGFELSGEVEGNPESRYELRATWIADL